MKYLIVILALVTVTAYADKIRYFDGNGNPLPEGKEGPLSIVCNSEQEWNDSGCPPNITANLDGKLRLKTQAEKDADKTAEEQAAILAEKKFSKAEIRLAFRALGKEDVLNGLINSSQTFKDDWADNPTISLNDPRVQQALQGQNLDINAIKLAILAVRKQLQAIENQ